MSGRKPRPPLSVPEINHLPAPGDGSGLAPDERFYREEVQLALRNRGMPLELMREPITPSGAHYLLLHFDIPAGSPDWQIEISGRVSKPMQLSLADIKALPAVTLSVTLECAGNGRALLSPRSLNQPWFTEAVSTAAWTGTPLRGLLEEAGLDDSTVDLVFTGGDWGVQGGKVQPYQRSLSKEEALREEVLLVYEMNGEPLPVQHGYPLRLLVPGWYGMASVKWLQSIDAISEPFTGYQMTEAYRDSQAAADPGEPVSLMKPRALMIPPGIPDFPSRVRVLPAGRVQLEGRAWVGRGRIERVEISTDDGRSWQEADLQEPVAPTAWRGWTSHWDAVPGRYTLCARATDDKGRTQPTDQPWNYQGMANNMVQRIPVIVT